MTGIQLAPQTVAAGPRSGVTPRSRAWCRFRSHQLAVVGLIVVGMLVLLAVAAPALHAAGLLADPDRVDTTAINAGMSGAHPFGADDLGRDILARTVFGARVSLSVGIVVQAAVVLIGGSVGLAAGYFGGRVDNVLMRLTDVMFAFPDLLFVLFVAAILGPGFWHIFLAVGAVSWAYTARLVRGLTRSVRAEPYVEAARACGGGPFTLILRHIVPNIAGPIVVNVTFAVPGAIFIEAFLSFVGVGIRPPTASWGVMINEGYQAIFAHPLQVLAPALAISLTTMAFTFVGDGLRDSLDARSPEPPDARLRGSTRGKLAGSTWLSLGSAWAVRRIGQIERDDGRCLAREKAGMWDRSASPLHAASR